MTTATELADRVTARHLLWATITAAALGMLALAASGSKPAADTNSLVGLVAPTQQIVTAADLPDDFPETPSPTIIDETVASPETSEPADDTPTSGDPAGEDSAGSDGVGPLKDDGPEPVPDVDEGPLVVVAPDVPETKKFTVESTVTEVCQISAESAEAARMVFERLGCVMQPTSDRPIITVHG